jgi:hypothetical protein
MDKSMVEVCSVGNALRLHDVAVLHNLSEAAKGIEEFIEKKGTIQSQTIMKQLICTLCTISMNKIT